MKVILTVVLFFSVFITSCGSMHQEKIRNETISSEIIGFGIIDKNDKQYVPGKGPFGKEFVAEIPAYKQQTTEVPATLGTRFGFSYIIDGTPVGKEIGLRIRIKHPEMNGKTLTEIKAKAFFGKAKSFYFTFDKESEIVEGTFQFHIFYKNKLLIEKEFNVSK